MAQEATANFLSTRLFQYFASDEVDADGEFVISEMMQAYFESGYKVSAVLRSLFNSDYFKSEKCMYSRVKGPVESVVGTARLAGTYQEPTLDVHSLWAQTMFMGQGLLAPPTVEGWHEGVEWIDSGSLVERINFAAKELSDPTKEGVKDIIHRVTAAQKDLSDSEKLVDSCLDFMGPIQVEADTREGLIEFAESQGVVRTEDGYPDQSGSTQIARLIGMIASTREYQLA